MTGAVFFRSALAALITWQVGVATFVSFAAEESSIHTGGSTPSPNSSNQANQNSNNGDLNLGPNEAGFYHISKMSPKFSRITHIIDNGVSWVTNFEVNPVSQTDTEGPSLLHAWLDASTRQGAKAGMAITLSTELSKMKLLSSFGMEPVESKDIQDPTSPALNEIRWTIPLSATRGKKTYLIERIKELKHQIDELEPSVGVSPGGYTLGVRTEIVDGRNMSKLQRASAQEFYNKHNSSMNVGLMSRMTRGNYCLITTRPSGTIMGIGYVKKTGRLAEVLSVMIDPDVDDGYAMLWIADSFRTLIPKMVDKVEIRIPIKHMRSWNAAMAAGFEPTEVISSEEQYYIMTANQNSKASDSIEHRKEMYNLERTLGILKKTTHRAEAYANHTLAEYGELLVHTPEVSNKRLDAELVVRAALMVLIFTIVGIHLNKISRKKLVDPVRAFEHPSDVETDLQDQESEEAEYSENEANVDAVKH